ncbi:hypothetical protein GGX14DRAFT_464392, partial [Mycena pura]
MASFSPVNPAVFTTGRTTAPLGLTFSKRRPARCPCNSEVCPVSPGCFVGCSLAVFVGSAIFMNALLDDISNIYTVSLDGKSTDVDGVRPGGALLCYTLFSQAGLDPTVEHNISLSIKGLSPKRNTTLDNDDTFFFWLDNFVSLPVLKTVRRASERSFEPKFQKRGPWRQVSLSIISARHELELSLAFHFELECF